MNHMLTSYVYVFVSLSICFMFMCVLYVRYVLISNGSNYNSEFDKNVYAESTFSGTDYDFFSIVSKRQCPETFLYRRKTIFLRISKEVLIIVELSG